MSEIKSKPCPFCGSSDVSPRPYGEHEGGKPWSVYYVHCCNCGCDGPTVRVSGEHDDLHETARGASIDLWNRRGRNDA